MEEGQGWACLSLLEQIRGQTGGQELSPKGSSLGKTLGQAVQAQFQGDPNKSGPRNSPSLSNPSQETTTYIPMLGKRAYLFTKAEGERGQFKRF